jgi:hypothetical protein
METEMSRGLGKIQRAALEAIQRCAAEGRKPTTYTIACDVYQIQPDADGNRCINDAQHVAVKRALGGLRRKGLVTGVQDMNLTRWADSGRAKGERFDGWWRAERCCIWKMTAELSVPQTLKNSFEEHLNIKIEDRALPFMLAGKQ